MPVTGRAAGMCACRSRRALKAGIDLLLPPGPGGVPLAMDDDGGAGDFCLDARITGFVFPADGCCTLVSGCDGGSDRGDLPPSLALSR